jgi:hypothetical protein
MTPHAFATVVLATLLTGCATHYSWEASVPVSGPVGRICLAAALDSEDDVFDVLHSGEDRLAFRLSLPGVKRDDLPLFSLGDARSPDGTSVLTLSTTYAEGLFRRDSNAQLMRARALVTRITEECTGRRPTLGEPQPCGAGELQDLCVLGSY